MVLQSCSTGSSRCARRALIILLVWGLFVIATVQFRHSGHKNFFFNAFSSEVGLLPDSKNEFQSDTARRFNSQKQISTSQFQPKQERSKAYGLNVHNGDNSTISNLINFQLNLVHQPLQTEDELINEIEARLPSLPLSYWTNFIKFGQAKSTKITKQNCTPLYPNVFELEFNNLYWQTLHTSNGTFQLFDAFYDNRKLSRIGPAIRIIGMINRIEPTVKCFCQMWFKGEREARIVDVFEYKYIWYSKWGNYKQDIYQPYVIACKVPQSHWQKGPPASISLVEKRCDTAKNSLKVIYNKPPKKKDFAVCVKGLDFLHEDLSIRLIEWIELIGLLGADKIFFYQLQVHPNVSKVLQYYEQLGKVHVTPLTLPGGQPNLPAFQHMYLTKKTNHKRQNELIPYNDCLYKHMYEYEYIALLDVDEVIMPVQDTTWKELMKRVMPKALKFKNETKASYNVRNVYFFDDLMDSHGSFNNIPRYMHMLQHVYRSKNFTKPNQYIKCFHNPERVVTLHNHFPLACLGAGCSSYPIDTEDAQLQHYRADCVKSLKKTCIEYREKRIQDTTIWRYKDKLVSKVRATLKILGFLNTTE
ncbi:uncharacterized protein LOC106645338 [Copidosoma floridanum]|uniref:uncharacterized protein LOC106645338 n=1 Tax=Copidosoma floridanum TaxID=29053 RepID=UPI0006C99E07|nr:uncharacterized protein LOC106645338 [Copidosoma floridanum]